MFIPDKDKERPIRAITVAAANRQIPYLHVSCFYAEEEGAVRMIRENNVGKKILRKYLGFFVCFKYHLLHQEGRMPSLPPYTVNGAPSCAAGEIKSLRQDFHDMYSVETTTNDV